MKSECVILVNGKYHMGDLSWIMSAIEAYEFTVAVKTLPDIEWIQENITGNYIGSFYDPPDVAIFYFEDSDDAFLFSLMYSC